MGGNSEPQQIIPKDSIRRNLRCWIALLSLATQSEFIPWYAYKYYSSIKYSFPIAQATSLPSMLLDATKDDFSIKKNLAICITNKTLIA